MKGILDVLRRIFCSGGKSPKKFPRIAFFYYIKKAKINSYKLLLYLLNLMTNPNETAILGY